jgi:uncharacterized protein
MTATEWALLLVSSVVAGGMNAIAGGGTLLTFPVLLGVGISPVVANGTSTVGLWPGGLTGYLAFRPSLRGAESWIRWLVIPGVLGGLCGAVLVLWSGDARFRQIVPWLILAATTLFLVQPVITAQIRSRAASASTDTVVVSPLWLALAQGAMSVYGGYFGAGAGILMLAAYALLGVRDLARMNAFKNLAAISHNLSAVLVFVVAGTVQWRIAIAMMGASMLGGWLAGRWAQRIDPRVVRAVIVVIGLATSATLFMRR